MKRLRRLVLQLAGTLFPGHHEADIAMAIEEHLEMQIDENLRRGMTPEEARRAALIKFGGVEATKERYRDQRGLPVLETLVQDLRFAARSFLRRPASIAVIIASLAIAIGLNTTLFTWLKAVYLNPVPAVADSRHLLTINANYKFGSGYSNSYQDFEYFRDHSHLFAGLFAHEMEILAVNSDGWSEMTNGGIASGDYFNVLHTPVVLGRAFRPDDDRSGAKPVIVLGDGLWRRRFGGTANVLGKMVAVNRVPFTVIGVAAPGFPGIYGGLRQDFWIPLSSAQALDPNHVDPLTHGMGLQIMGRTKPGVTLTAVQSELSVLSRQVQPLDHKDSPDYRAQAYPLHQAQRGFHSTLFQFVQVLGVAVVIVLLLACFNAANLLVGRATERAREMGVRMSLGAARRRLVRQLLTESFAIAVIGGVSGLLLVYATRSLPMALVPPGVELYLNTDLDWTVILFLFAITAGTTLVFGLLPAFETCKVNIADVLKDGAGTVTAGRLRGFWRRFLVVGQVTLAVAALFGAALFTQYVRGLMNADRGFDEQHILTAEADLSAAGLSEARGEEFFSASARRLEAIPGVQSAGWTTFLPMSDFGGGNVRSIEVAGYNAPDGHPLSVVVDAATPNYLHTLRIPVVKGREFRSTDSEKANQVLLVNQKFVEQYLNGRNPIGSAVKVGKTWRTIIGVHSDYVYRDPSQPPSPTIMLPIAQDYAADAILVIRTNGDPAQYAGPLQTVLRRLDPNVASTRIMTMEENVGFHFAPLKVGTESLLFFAAVACTLAAIGIYAVLATFVAQRRREFGIRIALGATPHDVRRKVLTESALLSGIGAIFGLALSAGLGALVRSDLFVVNPFDPKLYVAAGGAMLLTVAFSSVGPTLAASRLEPMNALRGE